MRTAWQAKSHKRKQKPLVLNPGGIQGQFKLLCPFVSFVVKKQEKLVLGHLPVICNLIALMEIL
ncbi:MAG: hypothetical protein H6562_23880 [Lewinellaceae bacterium]|nr:hypothetical protein [Lewinellaceae bacterium]